MYMTTIFLIFAAVALLAALLMPHVVHNLGYVMATIYLGLAVCSALLTIARRAR